MRLVTNNTLSHQSSSDSWRLKKFNPHLSYDFGLQVMWCHFIQKEIARKLKWLKSLALLANVSFLCIKFWACISRSSNATDTSVHLCLLTSLHVQLWTVVVEMSWLQFRAFISVCFSSSCVMNYWVRMFTSTCTKSG